MQSPAGGVSRSQGLGGRTRRTGEGVARSWWQVLVLIFLGSIVHTYFFRTYIMSSLSALPSVFHRGSDVSFSDKSYEDWTNHVETSLHNISERIGAIEQKLSSKAALQTEPLTAEREQRLVVVTDKQTEAISRLERAIAHIQEGLKVGRGSGMTGGEVGEAEAVSTRVLAGDTKEGSRAEEGCLGKRKEGERMFLTAMVMVRIFKEDRFNITFEHLKQWMAYLHYGGVEHVYVYDAAIRPEERLGSQMGPLVAAGLATYYDYELLFPDHEQAKYGDGYDPLRQPNSYAHCLRTHGAEMDHVLQADLDEFPFSVRDSTRGFIAFAVREAHASRQGVHVGETSLKLPGDIRRRLRDFDYLERKLDKWQAARERTSARWGSLLSPGSSWGFRSGRGEERREWGKEVRSKGRRSGRGSGEVRSRRGLLDQEGLGEAGPIGQLMMQCMFFQGFGDPSKRTLIERYTRRKRETAGDVIGWTSRMKTIYRPANWVEGTRIDAHSAEVRGETLVFDSEVLRFNHYWGPRLQNWGPDTPETITTTVEDLSILPIANALRMDKYSFGGCLPPEDW